MRFKVDCINQEELDFLREAMEAEIPVSVMVTGLEFSTFDSTPSSFTSGELRLVKPHQIGGFLPPSLSKEKVLKAVADACNRHIQAVVRGCRTSTVRYVFPREPEPLGSDW